MERLSHTAVYICHMPYFFLLPALTPIVPFHQRPLDNVCVVPCTNKVPWKQPSWSSFFLSFFQWSELIRDNQIDLTITSLIIQFVKVAWSSLSIQQSGPHITASALHSSADRALFLSDIGLISVRRVSPASHILPFIDLAISQPGPRDWFWYRQSHRYVIYWLNHPSSSR